MRTLILLLLLATRALANPNLVTLSSGTTVGITTTPAVSLTTAPTGLAVNVSNTVTVGTHAVTINSDVGGVAVTISNTTLAPAYVRISSTGKTTYAASVTGLATAASATDFLAVSGSATKTIKITAITISATQTTGGVAMIMVVKRSTANTGGTAVALTVTPYSSTNAAPTGTAFAYTANPTVGTLVGNVYAVRKFIPATTADSAPISLTWGSNSSQAAMTQQPTLNGVGQALCLNLAEVTVTGSIFAVTVEWTEE